MQQQSCGAQLQVPVPARILLRVYTEYILILPLEGTGKSRLVLAGAVPSPSWEAVEPLYRISSSPLIVEGASQALGNQLLCATKSLG